LEGKPFVFSHDICKNLRNSIKILRKKGTQNKRVKKEEKKMKSENEK
jgi:hypothetical protein